MKKLFIFLPVLLLIPILISSRILLNNETDIFTCIKQDAMNAENSVIISTNSISSSKLSSFIGDLQKKAVSVYILTQKQSLYENLKRSDLLLAQGCSLSYLQETSSNLPEFIIIDGISAYIGNYSLGSQNNSIWSFLYSTADGKELSSIKNAYAQMKLKSTPYTAVKDTITFVELKENPDKYKDLWVTVKGRAEDIYTSKKGTTYFIKFEKSKKTVTIVIFNEVLKELKAKNIVPLYYLNKDISVSGKLINHSKYGWEIILESSSDIRFSD